MLPMRGSTTVQHGSAYELLRNSAEADRGAHLERADIDNCAFQDEAAGMEQDENLNFDSLPPIERRKSDIISRSRRWKKLASVLFTYVLYPFMRNQEDTPSKPVSPAHSSTAWLDGLRGVACVMVVFYHSKAMFEPFSSTQHKSWLFSQLAWISNLPILNIWNNGRAMVAVFFVVSGFSISYSSLGHTRRRNLDKVFRSLASSTFRRYLRLYMPAVATSFANMLASYFGWYGGTGINARHRQPPKFDSITAQLGDYWTFLVRFTNPFRTVSPAEVHLPISPYDPNLWTIPTEFAGSIVVFATILGVCSLRRLPRLLILLGLTISLAHSQSLNLLLFIGGCLLAEIHYYGADWRKKFLPPTSAPDIPLSLSPKRWTKTRPDLLALFFNLFCVLNFLTALYRFTLKDPMKHRGRTVFHALQLVLAIDHAPCLQAIFTTRLARFLGRISFCLYLVHGGVLHTFGWHVWGLLKPLMGEETAMQQLCAKTSAAILSYALSVWIAHVLSWAVDDRSVKFVKWLWGALLESENQERVRPS